MPSITKNNCELDLYTLVKIGFLHKTKLDLTRGIFLMTIIKP